MSSSQVASALSADRRPGGRVRRAASLAELRAAFQVLSQRGVARSTAIAAEAAGTPIGAAEISQEVSEFDSEAFEEWRASLQVGMWHVWIAAADPTAEITPSSPLWGILLSHHQADDTAVFWPPVCAVACFAANSELSVPAVTTIEDELLQAALAFAGQQGCVMAQAVLSQDEEAGSAAFVRNGLPDQGTVIVMQRPAGDSRADFGEKGSVRLTTEASRVPPDQIELIPLPECTPLLSELKLAQLIESTYFASRDFPELLEKKTGLQSIKTHRLQGNYNPQDWYLLRYQNQEAGILMFANHSELGRWELIYLGILPEFRNRGLGRCALERALSNPEFKKALVFLGVDSRNTYAVRLYKSLGFVAVIGMRVHFRWLAAHP